MVAEVRRGEKTGGTKAGELKFCLLPHFKKPV